MSLFADDEGPDEILQLLGIDGMSWLLDPADAAPVRQAFRAYIEEGRNSVVTVTTIGGKVAHVPMSRIDAIVESTRAQRQRDALLCQLIREEARPPGWMPDEEDDD